MSSLVNKLARSRQLVY